MKRRYTNPNQFVDLATQALESIDKPETKKGITAEIATRSRTIDFFSILQGLPNPDPVLKKLNRSIQVYEDLSYDSRVSAVVQSRKSAVQSMEWDIIGEKTPQSEIDFHKEYLTTYKMEDVLSEILDAPLYGYKPFEIMWNSDGRRVVPVDFVGKPPRWFKYGSENELRFLTARDMIYGEELPENKFIVARHKPTYDNPYGLPVLSACFWPVTFRKNGLKWWSVFIEKYGMPFLLAKAPAGERTERITEVADMLENMVQDAIAVVPSEYEVDIKEAASTGTGKTPAHKTYLDTMNMEISMAILGTNLTTEVSGGSYAASQSHMEVREDIIEGDAKIAEGTFDALIEITHKFNFGNSPPPRFKLFAEEKVDEARAKRDLNLSKAGVRLTKEYYKRSYNLTDDDIDRVDESAEAAAPFGGGDNE